MLIMHRGDAYIQAAVGFEDFGSSCGSFLV